MAETSVSLLERLQSETNEESWRRLHDLYAPLIRRWLSDPALKSDIDDLTQDVLAILIRELPRFRRQRTGSFRAWAKTITVNCIRQHWRSRRTKNANLEPPVILDQLQDPASELNRRWDKEHDEFIVNGLLEQIRPEFSAVHWKVFCRLALGGATAAKAAAEFEISVNAVLLVKSRVLKRLREEGRGLID